MWCPRFVRGLSRVSRALTTRMSLVVLTVLGFLEEQKINNDHDQYKEGEWGVRWEMSRTFGTARTDSGQGGRKFAERVVANGMA